MGAIGRGLAFAFDPGVGAGVGEVAASARRMAAMARRRGYEAGGLRPDRWPRWKDLELALAGARPRDRAVLVALVSLAAAALAAGAGGLAAEAGAALVGEALAQVQAPGFDLFADRAATRSFLGRLHEIGDGGAKALAAMFRVLNLALVFAAGGILVYIAAQAILDTARGGRPGASAVMVLRIVAALALMAPIGGFNGAQHAILGVAGLGGAAASKLWSEFSAEAVGSGAAPMPVVPGEAHRRLVGDLLVAETCAAAAAIVAARNGDPAYIRGVTRRTGGRTVYGYDGAGRGLPRGACGAIEFARPSGAGIDDAIVEARYDAVIAGLGPIGDIAEDLAERLVPGGASYGEALPDADAVVAGSGIAEAYTRTVVAGIERARESAPDEILARVEDAAKNGGWLAAPLVLNTVARAHGTMAAAVAAVPAVEPPADALLRRVPEAHGAARKTREWLDNAGAGGSSGETFLSGDMSFLDMLDTVWKTVWEKVWGSGVGLVEAEAPLASMAAIGGTLVIAAFTAFGTVATAVAAGNLLLGAGGAAWSVVDGPVTTLLMGLLVAGLVLGYLVPLIPFIRFAFGLAVWLFQIVEGLFGVALWLIAWLSMDKDRLLPAGAREGAGLLLAIALRPALMVLGLLLGLILASILVGYLNRGFGPLIASLDNAGPIDSIAYIFLYAVLAYVLVNTAFSTIDRLPSAVLGWIGARVDGGSDGESAGRAVVAGFGRAERMAPRLGGIGRRGGGPTP